jgi:phosphatidylinositol alpha-1,6-mannosyltransferase
LTERTRGHTLETLLVAERFPPRISGRSSILRELVAHLPGERTVVSTPGHRAARSLDRALPAEVRRAPTLFFGSTGIGERIWRAHLGWTLRRRRPGLLVAFDVRPDGVIAHEILKSHEIPYLLHLDAPRLAEVRHRIREGEGGKRLRRILTDAVGVVTSSRTCWLEAYRLGIPPHRLEVVPAGVDLERFHPGPKSGELAKRLGVEKGPVLLSVVGDSPSKDFETILRAFSAARGTKRGLKLVVVGLDEPRSWKKLLRNLRIDRAVRFVGPVPVSEMPEYYRLADAFLMAHREDPASRVVQGVEVCFLEALATGIPVLATRTPATEELVPADEVGILVEPEAHQRLGKATIDLLQNEELRRAMSERARQRAEATHDARECGRAFRELLEVVYFRRLRLGELEPAPGAVAAGSARPAA